MATIPLYQRRISPSAGGITPQISGADPMAGALGNVARTLDQIGQDQERQAKEAERIAKAKEREDAAAWTANAMSAAHVQWIDRSRSAMDEAAPGAPDFSAQMLKEYDNYTAEQLKQAPNDTAKQYMGERLSSLRTNLYGRWVNFQAEAGVQERNRVWGQTSKNIEAVAARDPEQAKIMLAEAQATLRDSQHKEWAAATFDKIQAPTIVAAVQGMVERNPAGALKLLDQYFGIAETKRTPANVTPEEEAKLRAQLGDTYDEVMARPAGDSSRLGILQAELASASEADKPALRREIARVMKSDPQALAALQPEKAPELLEAGAPEKTGNFFIDKLDPQVAWTMRNRAQTEMGRSSGVQRELLGHRVQNTQAMAANGVVDPNPPSAEEFVAMFGPEVGGIRYQEQVAEPLKMASAIKMVQSASPEQRAAIVAATTPAEGAPNYAAQSAANRHILAAIATVNKQLDDDPSGYVLRTSPRVSAARVQADKAGWTPEATAAYATETIAEQTRMGVQRPNILTASASDAITTAFNDPQTGGKQAAKLVSQLEAQWGRHWPQVYGQLARSGKMPASALVIPNMKDMGARERLASVSGMKSDELKAMIPAGEGKDIKEALQREFEPAARTMMAQGVGGYAAVSNVMEQAEKLAYLYRSGGKSLKDATRQAYDETIGWRYEFGATYRIPNEQQPELVRNGAALALRDIGRTELFTSRNAIGVQNREAQTADAIRTNAFWVTNEDETGIVLKIKGADNSDRIVERKDGKPVEYKWQDLRRMAADDVEPSPVTADERMTWQQNRLNEMERMRNLRNGQ